MKTCRPNIFSGISDETEYVAVTTAALNEEVRQ